MISAASLSHDAEIELFEVDLTPWGDTVRRFHAGTNQLGGAVVWQGNEYTPAAIEAEGFAYESQGQRPTPTLRLAKIANQFIVGFIIDYDEILGAKVTRKRTLAKYLDAVNFPDGINPDADPTQAFADAVYEVRRRTSEDDVVVEYELGSSDDSASEQIPGRQIIANTCTAVYRNIDTGCDWLPDPETGPFFDDEDNATTAGNDQCSHRLSGCECRFGAGNPLPYVGFPAAGLLKR